MYTELIEQTGEISGPAHGDCRGRHAVFEHHVPADEPRDQFAERRISVRIRTAGHRNQGGKLGIAHSGKAATDRRDDEGKDDRRARMLCRSLAGDHENTAADHGADTESRQSPGSKRALEARAFAGISVGKIGFLGEQLAEHGFVPMKILWLVGLAGQKRPAYFAGPMSLTQFTSISVRCRAPDGCACSHRAYRGSGPPPPNPQKTTWRTCSG